MSLNAQILDKTTGVRTGEQGFHDELPVYSVKSAQKARDSYFDGVCEATYERLEKEGRIE